MTPPRLYPKAEPRILFPDDSTPAIDTSRLTLVFHTMSGYLFGSEAQWKTNGPTGVRSHFGIGGPYDAAGDNGRLVQWTPTTRVAYAAWDSNPFGIQVETSDGATTPIGGWSVEQVEMATMLAVDFAKWCNVPRLVLCNDPRGTLGTVGWHRRFASWNQSGHECPGTAREWQIVNKVLPEANRRLATHGLDLPMLQADYDTLVDNYRRGRHSGPGTATEMEEDGIIPATASLVRALTTRVAELDTKIDAIVAKLGA